LISFGASLGKLLLKCIEDIFIFVGIALIITAASLYNPIVGILIAGIFSLAIGFYFAKNPPKGVK